MQTWDRFALIITLNGDRTEIEPGSRLTDLIKTLPGDPRGIAIERNGEIVPKSEHGATVLSEGDCLEVVVFVGGG